jgi:sirohydrochlorin cobaltochelatase
MSTQGSPPSPIVLMASGSTRMTREAYQPMEDICRRRFPAHEIHWAFSARAVRRRIQERGQLPLPTPEEVLAAIHDRGQVPVVQALFLLCGLEFHDAVRSVRRFWPQAAIGLPLLSAPADVEALGDALAPAVAGAGDDAVLWVGHGTRHPSGMAYEVLEARLRKRFGARACLGLLEGEPSPDGVAARLRDAGIRRVRLRPLMLVAGAHYWRDMAGEGPGSWKSRLLTHGLDVVGVPQALLDTPGVADIFADHLQGALAASSPGNGMHSL